jgi:hypothetical protein
MIDLESLRALLDCRKNFLLLRFFYEIELIPVKLLCDSCEIPAFQKSHKTLRIDPIFTAWKSTTIHRLSRGVTSHIERQDRRI